MLPIRALWEKHLATPFPVAYAGVEVEHVDLKKARPDIGQIQFGIEAASWA